MFKLPILLLIFNRPDSIKKVIKVLKKLKPIKVYVSADGPRDGNFLDYNLCRESREEILNIDWECKIAKNYSNFNLGCRDAVSKGITWFFKKEELGIILEDDCIPNLDFFKFCEMNLKKYRNNKKIGCITGNNFLKKSNIKDTYYFSRYPHCWGWATWSRAWEKYKKNITYWPNLRQKKFINKIFFKKIEQKYWTKILNSTYDRKIDSWAYPWSLCLWKNDMLTITPKFNLVKNIGFGKNATHTVSDFDNNRYKSFKLPKKFIHPKQIKINYDNDDYVFNNHFKGKNYLYPHRFIYLLKILFFSPITFYTKFKKVIF